MNSIDDHTSQITNVANHPNTYDGTFPGYSRRLIYFKWRFLTLEFFYRRPVYRIATNDNVDHGHDCMCTWDMLNNAHVYIVSWRRWSACTLFRCGAVFVVWWVHLTWTRLDFVRTDNWNKVDGSRCVCIFGCVTKKCNGQAKGRCDLKCKLKERTWKLYSSQDRNW